MVSHLAINVSFNLCNASTPCIELALAFVFYEKLFSFSRLGMLGPSCGVRLVRLAAFKFTAGSVAQSTHERSTLVALTIRLHGLRHYSRPPRDDARSITVLPVVVDLEVGRRRNGEALEEADLHHLDGDAELLIRVLVD